MKFPRNFLNAAAVVTFSALPLTAVHAEPEDTTTSTNGDPIINTFLEMKKGPLNRLLDKDAQFATSLITFYAPQFQQLASQAPNRSYGGSGYERSILCTFPMDDNNTLARLGGSRYFPREMGDIIGINVSVSGYGEEEPGERVVVQAGIAGSDFRVSSALVAQKEDGSYWRVSGSLKNSHNSQGAFLYAVAAQMLKNDGYSLEIHSSFEDPNMGKLVEVLQSSCSYRK